MSKLWLRNSKITVDSLKKPILCDECPCPPPPSSSSLSSSSGSVHSSVVNTRELTFSTPYASVWEQAYLSFNPGGYHSTCIAVGPSSIWVGGQRSFSPVYSAEELDFNGNQTGLRLDLGSQTNSIAVDSSGNVYLGGVRSGGVSLRKFNSSGTLQWSADHGNDVHSLCIDASGNVYVVGKQDASNFAATKFDSSGAQQWKSYINGTSSFPGGPGYGCAIAGSSIFCSKSLAISGVEVTEVNAADGSRIGSSGVILHSLSGNYNDVATDGTHVFGQGFAGGGGVRVSKGDPSTQTEVWGHNLSPAEMSRARGIDCDSSGRIYVSGARHGDFTGTMGRVTDDGMGGYIFDVFYHGATHDSDLYGIVLSGSTPYVTGRGIAS